MDNRNVAGGCGIFFDAFHNANQDENRDRSTLSFRPDPRSAAEVIDGNSPEENLRHDLMFLAHKDLEFNQCASSDEQLNPASDPSSGCPSEPLMHFQVSHHGEPEGELPIWQIPGSPAFFYETGMTIDADGAPNAYHPDNTGLDDLRNAGAPGNWEGLAKDRDGEPYIQGPDDPFPGYYVSETALADRSKAVDDPARYVDASKIPFIVLPGSMAREVGARPGDFAAVLNVNNGRSSYAIFGDVGPSDRIGEGSVALAENLGVRSDARNGGARRGILYLIFPGSGNGRPRTIEEINTESEILMQQWGRIHGLTRCSTPPPAAASGRN